MRLKRSKFNKLEPHKKTDKSYYFQMNGRTWIFARAVDDNEQVTLNSGWDIIEDVGYDFYAESTTFPTLKAAKEYFVAKIMPKLREPEESV